MSTFFDPATIRRLAATGDAFYRGAAWILDQQDAAVVATAPTEDEYRRAYVTPDGAGRSTGPHLHFSTRGGSSVTPNAADLGAPRIG